MIFIGIFIIIIIDESRGNNNNPSIPYLRHGTTTYNENKNTKKKRIPQLT